MAEFNFSDIVKANIDVIVWNYARANNMHLIKRASQIGIRNIIHDTEGIPYDMSKYYRNLSANSFTYIDEIWLWGSHQYDHIISLLDELSVQNVNVIVTGSIRYEYIKSLPKVNIQSNIGNYLWNTNFPFISPLYQKPFEEFEQLHKVHKLYSANDALELVINASHLRTSSASCIQHLLAICDSSKILLRPHPFESKEFYKSYFEIDSTRLTYSEGGDVHNDIDVSSVVLHSGCQTCLDSFIRGIPSFVFSYNYNNLWSKICPTISYSDMHKLSSTAYLREALDIQDALFREYKIENYVGNIYSNLNLSSSTVYTLNKRNGNFRSIYLILWIKIRAKLTSILTYLYFRYNLRMPYSKKVLKLNSSMIQTYLLNTFNAPSIFIGKLVTTK